MKVTALSLEEPVSETEFLRRELGVLWERVSTFQLEHILREIPPGQDRCLIATSGPESLLDLLSDAPPSSVVVLLLGDEAYANSALALASLEAVHVVFKQHSWDRLNTFRYLASSFLFLLDSLGTGVRFRDILKQFVKGARVRRQQRRWLGLANKVEVLPLGYASVFSRAMTSHFTHDDGDLSLLEAGKVVAPSERDYDYGFSGDRGQAQRQVCLTQAGRTSSCVIRWTRGPWNGGLGAEQAFDYIALLKTVRFSLCPPGGISNESFRITESVICGALPLVLDSCASQGARLSTGLRLGLVETSWRRIFRKASIMEETQRQECLRKSQAKLNREFNQTRQRIRESISRDGSSC